MLFCICLFCPAGFSIFLFETFTRKRLSLHGIASIFVINTLIINGCCFLMKNILQIQKINFLYSGINITPDMALKHLMLAIPVSIVLAVMYFRTIQTLRKKDASIEGLSKWLSILSIGVLLCLLCQQITEIENKNELINDEDFYPVKEVMELNGYQENSDYLFRKNAFGKEILISFDFEDEICRKNLYSFSLKNSVRKYKSEYYVKKEQLEAILNCRLTFEKNTIASEAIKYEQHEWTELPALIAHAGGGIRTKEYNTFYTNSLEALVSNYNLGHRIFEFDFYLTSDLRLASIHDWTTFGDHSGVAFSSEKWKNSKAYGVPVTEACYTTMLLEDILDEMLVNKDMFLVTDTKSFEITTEETKLQFQLIYEEAMERDPDLLNRIIPQIYNEELYDVVTSVYNFPSIIYTAYATYDSAEKIIAFANKHENIKVITAPVGDGRFDESMIRSLHESDLLLYNHTINTYAELTDGEVKNIDGFYTDLLLPRDLSLYEQLDK